jgi:hypothetical protein
MKKKIIAAAAISAALIGGTAVTIYANNDGYELYKDALKNTHTLNSASVLMEASVIDNGQEINKMEMTTAYNLKQGNMQGSLTTETGTQEQSFDLAYQNENFIIKNTEKDTYYLIKDDESKEEKEANFKKYHNPELLKIMEHAFDALTVQVHDDFEVKKAGSGNPMITVDLTNDEIPVLFKEIGEYMVKKGTEIHENATMSTTEYPFLSEDLSTNVPALVKNIQIKNVKLNTQLSEDNIIQKQTVYMNISGEDNTGVSHNIEMKMNLEYSNINEQSVKPLTIDTKNTKTIETSQFKEAHHF